MKFHARDGLQVTLPINTDTGPEKKKMISTVYNKRKFREIYLNIFLFT